MIEYREPKPNSVFRSLKIRKNVCNAFKNAINRGMKYPEDYMYMYSHKGRDYFKHRERRKYKSYKQEKNEKLVIVPNDLCELTFADSSFQIRKPEDVDIFLNDIMIQELYFLVFPINNWCYEIHKTKRDGQKDEIKMVVVMPFQDDSKMAYVDTYTDYEEIKRIVWRLRDQVNKNIRESNR